MEMEGGTGEHPMRAAAIGYAVAAIRCRAVSSLIDPISFEQFLRGVAGERDFDVMLEAKGKDVALLTLRSQLAVRGLTSIAGRLVGPGRSERA
jgi:hypothetical protein